MTHDWLAGLEGLPLAEAEAMVRRQGLVPCPVAETLDLPPYVGGGRVILRHRKDEARTVTGARAGDPMELE
jgi:hypothetical protein